MNDDLDVDVMEIDCECANEINESLQKKIFT